MQRETRIGSVDKCCAGAAHFAAAAAAAAAAVAVDVTSAEARYLRISKSSHAIETAQRST